MQMTYAVSPRCVSIDTASTEIVGKSLYFLDFNNEKRIFVPMAIGHHLLKLTLTLAV